MMDIANYGMTINWIPPQSDRATGYVILSSNLGDPPGCTTIIYMSPHNFPHYFPYQCMKDTPRYMTPLSVCHHIYVPSYLVLTSAGKTPPSDPPGSLSHTRLFELYLIYL